MPPKFLPWRVNGEIRECSILKIEDKEDESTEFHALAEVVPDEVAVQVLSRMNGRKLNGRIVEVRRWYERATGAGAETAQPDLPPPGKAAHHAERRRKHLSMMVMP